MSVGFHPPLEEYLEAIYSLSEEGIEVIQARLVERLGYSPQAVSEMVARLAADGYVDRSHRAVALTDKGQERALVIVRRHRLAERFLVDIVGLPWHKAHLEAGRWEHVISDDVEQRFIEILGNPTTCPHGSPIPGSGAQISEQIPLALIDSGRLVQIARVTEAIETDDAALRFCSDHGLIPGRSVSVGEHGGDGTRTLSLLDESGSVTETLELGPSFTRQIFVAAS